MKPIPALIFMDNSLGIILYKISFIINTDILISAKYYILYYYTHSFIALIYFSY